MRVSLPSQQSALSFFLAVTLVAAACAADAAWHGDTQPFQSKAQDGKVTALIPKDWVVEDHFVHGGGETLTWKIPYPSSDFAAKFGGPTARCLVTLRAARSSETPVMYSQEIGQQTTNEELRQLAVVTNEADWYTVVETRAHPQKLDVTTVGMHHTGVHDGVAASLLMVIPLEADTDKAWIRERVGQFSWLVEHFSVASATKTGGKVEVETVLQLQPKA